MFDKSISQGCERNHRLGRGLFILRYISSKAGGTDYPSVLLKIDNPRNAELIAVSSKDSYVLRGPGDGVVIRAHRETTIVLRVQPRHRGGSVDAELHCEPVSRFDTLPAESIPDRRADENPGRIAASGNGVEFLAHLAQRGDIIVPSGEWIGGPKDPRSIEGLEVRWPARPSGLEILTRVTVANGGHDLPESLTGEFTGTRGRGSPITCFDMRLCGARAGELVFRTDALFRGSAVQSQTGRAISFAGPTGREALVGLRVSILAAAAVAHRAPERDAGHKNPPRSGAGLPTSGRVRVFRGLKQSSSLPSS